MDAISAAFAVRKLVPICFRVLRQCASVPLSWGARALLLVLPLVVGLFLLVDWGVEYLWLEALGLESVFWTIRPLKAGLFLSAFVSVLLYFWINFRILSSHLDLATTAALIGRVGHRSGPAAVFRARRTAMKKEAAALVPGRRAS